ncbi:MAG: flagellar hook-basal body complex protein [Pseudomonadota bacterium]
MSFYTSLTGLNSATAQLAVTSNNIANVGTSGFKRSRADFGDIFSTSPLQKSSSNIGQGVSLKQVSQEFSQGNISTSGNSLDLAITGDGFFPLKSADGLQEVYTRNGSFTLNDQNNVVNSTGQRLQAASVDSSGKADLTNLSALTIPPKTSGEAVETTKIQLGLNLPADSAVIFADFDRTNPSTYNKSTALTVYDSGGNGYLATVYYAKTQNASQDSPYSKWQTYFFVGDSQVKPALQQATDGLSSALYVNKYGDVLPKSDSRVVPSSGTTEMYTLDQLTDTRLSTPSSAVGAALSSSTYIKPALSGFTAGTTKLNFSIKVDGSTLPQNISYTMTAADEDPEVLARNLEVKINNQLGVLSTDPRHGISVDFDPETAKFSIASGTTGDESSIEVSAFQRQTSNITLSGSFAVGDTVSASIDGSQYTYTVKADNTAADVAAGLAAAFNTGNASVTAAANSAGVLTFTGGADGAAFTPTVTLSASNTGTGAASSVTTSAGSTTADSGALNFLGLESGLSTLKVAASSSEAVRGKASEPAKMNGDTMTINTTKNVAVASSNQNFFATVDGIASTFTVPVGSYSMDKLAEAIQNQINTITDPETGRQVTGVKVAFDTKTKQMTFTTGTTGDNASIQVTGSADWGLANTEMQFGATTDWVKLSHYTENGALQYVKNGAQTEDASELSTKTEWWPVYLDRGELSFDLTGKPVSPLSAMPFETAFLEGGKGALTMKIDFTQSTQYSSAFAVLSQSQDGAPEGELMGLDIGVDGLVNATYSNGSQVSLGKIVLANFSSPTGLRQVGDASYLASATSGNAKIGEAGSAGFGSIRAGATERANVDLTQELVDLITAQRNFQANAKAIETSSTMTSAIINIRS